VLTAGRSTVEQRTRQIKNRGEGKVNISWLRMDMGEERGGEARRSQTRNSCYRPGTGTPVHSVHHK
jgi:hypothetical protein